MKDIIIELFAQGKYSQIKNEIGKMNVVDIAQLFAELEEDAIMIVFRLLPKEMAADVFTYLSFEQQQYVIESITDKETKNIIDDLFLDDAVDLLEEMPANVVKKILKNTTEEKRKLINQFLKYPDNSAGSIMTIEYVDLDKEMTVKASLEHIKKTGVDKETIDICYITDKARRLEGIVPIRKLILNDENVIIDDIMDKNFLSIKTDDDQEEIAYLFKKYDLVAMPVVDKENRLVGIITIDDVVDIIEQENTEDFQKMAALEPSEEEYLKTSVFSLAKHRILWLLVLMFSATFTGNIIQGYEDILETVLILTTFIPMLMDTAGNSGSQSATLVIRGLALGQIERKDALKVVWKEFRVSIIVGFALAFLNFFRIYFFVEGADFLISLVVCLTLFLTVVLAKLVGGILPIIAKTLKLDPAIMAAPLITTIVDALALIAYFQLAAYFLGLV
ncbi:magnesium transporter [Natranaerovirga pectinivora]|uniref:Magnesium transporter MgtE n=1 Tax=Natranaerovirga pectinivora TaxID=682400 RepID=A0A4R3MG50_9FIRM|nr:magnesium transporter [Natranaerovirga pectinivora]TCT12142.1 magnesium transporter [Natranaerovirga pectinivora]